MAKGVAKGMAKGKPGAAQTSIQHLEAQFGEAANHLYEGLLDLNTPSMHIHQSFDQLMSMRDSLLSMYGVAMEPNGGGKGVALWQQWGPPAAALGAQDQSVADWKSKVIQLVAKRSKRSLTKGEMMYEVGGQVGGYTASLSCEHLQTAYVGEVAQSKRQAEHNAAKAAIAAEYPNEFAAASGAAAWGDDQGWWAPPAGAGGKKRPLVGAVEERDSKSSLNHAMQMILSRPVQKGDIVFDTKAVDEANLHAGYVSIVTVPTYDKELAYQGEQGDGKKQAEQNAAAQLLAALQEQIGAASEQYRAKRAKVRKEKLDKMKANAAEEVKEEEEQEPDVDQPLENW